MSQTLAQLLSNNVSWSGTANITAESGSVNISATGANSISLATNGSTRVTVNSSGQILAGSLGTAALPVWSFTGDTNTGLYSPAADTLAISNNGAETLRTDSAGRLLLGITTANANGGVLQLKSGITFPATQVASADPNTLDEYEEGAFTPVIQGTTTAGTGTYTGQVGAYIKVGRIAYVTGGLTWTAHTGTGNLRIAGLPFPSGSDGLGQLSYVNLTVTGAPYLGVVDNQSYADVFTLPTAGGSRATVAMDTAASVEFSFCYRTST